MHPCSPFVVATWTSFSFSGEYVSHFPNQDAQESKWGTISNDARATGLTKTDPGEPKHQIAYSSQTCHILAHLRAFGCDFSFTVIPSKFSFFNSQPTCPYHQRNFLWCHRMWGPLITHTQSTFAILKQLELPYSSFCSLCIRQRWSWVLVYPWLKGFPGCRTFNTKTREVPGKHVRMLFPQWWGPCLSCFPQYPLYLA